MKQQYINKITQQRDNIGLTFTGEIYNLEIIREGNKFCVMGHAVLDVHARIKTNEIDITIIPSTLVVLDDIKLPIYLPQIKKGTKTYEIHLGCISLNGNKKYLIASNRKTNNPEENQGFSYRFCFLERLDKFFEKINRPHYLHNNPIREIPIDTIFVPIEDEIREDLDLESRVI